MQVTEYLTNQWLKQIRFFHFSHKNRSLKGVGCQCWFSGSEISELMSLWFSCFLPHDLKKVASAPDITFLLRAKRRWKGSASHFCSLKIKKIKASLKTSSRLPFRACWPEICHIVTLRGKEFWENKYLISHIATSKNMGVLFSRKNIGMYTE